MAVKSIFNIKCFKDVKFWVEKSVFHSNIKKSENIFKISFPPCASKSFCLHMCYHILHIVWKWLAGTRGDVEQPQYPGPKPIKCHSTEREMNDSNDVL